MTAILHLSDPHFGTAVPRLADQLVALARDLRPDAVVVSGDLTQRAREEQFRAARAFLTRLDAPVLCVPGNHDMPLFNLPLRLLAPFARYRRGIGPQTQGRLRLPGVVVQGVNTANPLVWKSGRLSAASARRLAATFATAPEGAFRIAVLHHAPVPAADGTPADMARPSRALARLAAAGADIVLSGHTHMPHAGPAETAAGVLFLQAGTAVSTRLKTGANDFSLITLSSGALVLRSWIAAMGQDFCEAPPARFLRTASGWAKVNET